MENRKLNFTIMLLMKLFVIYFCTKWKPFSMKRSQKETKNKSD